MLMILIVIALVLFVYYFVYKPHTYWSDKKVKVSKPVVPVFGNSLSTVTRSRSFFQITVDLYNEYPKDRYNGIYQFNRPLLLVRDIDLIKKICIKDFDHFTDHTTIIDEENDPLFGKNLFGLRGQRWRAMRATLSPAFTSSKMRGMFTLMSECAKRFTDHFLQHIEQNTEIEMKDAFTRFTNDVIASTAFGIECDSLKEPRNEFYLMGKQATTFKGFQEIKLLIFVILPQLAKILKLKVMTEKVEDFFRSIVSDNIKQREEKGIVRPDLIHLLMEARKGKLKHESVDEDAGFATVEESQLGKEEAYQQKELTLDDMTAQALIFFFAGFDAASTACCFLAHELAVNPDVQIKLQNEIDDVLLKNDGNLTYDALLRMKYLDQVVSGCGLQVFNQKGNVLKKYVIGAASPEENSLEVEKGRTVVFPVAGLHRNPEFFPNPNKFDPDRFSDENKVKLVPGSFMPFGVGPRNCIGSRFALLEVKSIIFYLLSKFDLTVIKKTTVPMKIKKGGLNLVSENGFWLGFKPRKSTSL